MSVSILLSVGTPMGQWAEPAAALLAGFPGGRQLAAPAFTSWHDGLAWRDDPAGVEPSADQLAALTHAAAQPGGASAAQAGAWGGVDSRSCWTLDALRQCLPQAAYLVWVESPALGLAAALDAGQADDPARWLATWRAGARRLLRHVQRDPARCWVVDASDAWRHPQAWQALCAARFGLALTSAPDPAPIAAMPPAVADPLSLALASALASADAELQTLYAELQASCVVLVAETAIGANSTAAFQVDGTSAALRLTQLQAGQRAAAQAKLSANQAQAEVHRLTQSHDRLAGQAQAQAGELNAGRAELAAAKKENKLLLLQLHQVREELEAVCMARNEETAQASARFAQLGLQFEQAHADRDAQTALALDLQRQVADLAHAAQIQRAEWVAEMAAAKAQAEAEAQPLIHARDQAMLHAREQDSELAAARASALSAGEESELLLLELHQVQEELEVVCIARHEETAQVGARFAQLGLQLEQAHADRDAQAALALDLQHQVTGLAHAMQIREAEATALNQQIGALTQANASQASQIEAAQIQRAEWAAEMAAAQAQAEAEAQPLIHARDQALLYARQQDSELAAARASTLSASEENELLLLELHQVQEELEAVCLQRRALQATADSALPQTGLDLTIGEMRPFAERTALPHRELSFALRGLSLAGREVDEVTLRLVEHHGHPGLVVFANPKGLQLLDSWQESGREDGRPYALLVPGDSHSQPVFDAMSRTDWLLTQALVGRIAHQVQSHSTVLAAHWGHVARRLREQLLELPQRLRFDGLTFEPADTVPAGCLGLQFDQVHCGMRRLDRLTLRWWPTGPQAGIELRCDPKAGPPLPSWPTDEQGSLPEGLMLPMGLARGAKDAAASAAWARLTAADHDFVLALLAALPLALARISPVLLRATQLPDPACAAAALLGEARRRIDAIRAPVPAVKLANLAKRAMRKVRRSTTALSA